LKIRGAVEHLKLKIKIKEKNMGDFQNEVGRISKASYLCILRILSSAKYNFFEGIPKLYV